MYDYIVLFNPHSEEWLLFDYEEDKEEYAPNYGVAISNGKTIDETINSAVKMFNINPSKVKI